MVDEPRKEERTEEADEPREEELAEEDMEDIEVVGGRALQVSAPLDAPGADGVV